MIVIVGDFFSPSIHFEMNVMQALIFSPVLLTEKIREMNTKMNLFINLLQYLNSGAGALAGAYIHEKHNFTIKPT